MTAIHPAVAPVHRTSAEARGHSPRNAHDGRTDKGRLLRSALSGIALALFVPFAVLVTVVWVPATAMVGFAAGLRRGWSRRRAAGRS